MFSILTNIVNVLKKIEASGFKAYVVGGFVRDFYRNKENSDVDICTSAKPDDLKHIFDNIFIDQYGSVVLNYNGINFEITTFRREKKYLDNRHPTKIKYVKNLKTDLKRRDFTMNSICLTSDLNYIDYLGGRNDINKKIVKMIGKPEKRLKEDSLRILRAIRFATTLDFELEESLKNSIKNFTCSNGSPPVTVTPPPDKFIYVLYLFTFSIISSNVFSSPNVISHVSLL